MSSKLPVQLTRFIGREREVAAVRRLLQETHLVTLTGPGGSGKTRLALEVARQRDGPPDGIAWVDLAPLSDTALFPSAVARALGAPEQPGRAATETLVDFLRDRRLLLVLDNCEHVITASAQLVELLLHSCRHVRILATSREPLSLRGEQVYTTPALSLPPAAAVAAMNALAPASTATLGALGQYEAIKLFVDRASSVVPAFALTAENARTIAVLCQRLDGLPLAIELAATRVNVLTVEQIADRLDDRFTLLRADHRGEQSGRHQTLRAALDWSFELLTAPEQALFRRLSVFAGGCSLASVRSVCAGDGVAADQLLTLLSSLVNKSLVIAHTLQPGEARYALLETTRQYGAEKLRESGEESDVRERHLRCFLHLVEETKPKLEGEYQQRWLHWLEGEVDNIRTALSWSLRAQQVESGLRIAVALYQFWTIRDYREEALRWYERLLAQAHTGVSAAVRLNALTYASLMASFHGRKALQRRYADEASALGEGDGGVDKQALASSLGAQAFAAYKAVEAETAFALAQRGIKLLRDVGDRYQLGLSLTLYSFMAMAVGDYEAAHAMLDEGLPLLRATGNKYRIAMGLNFRGDLARCEEDYAAAVIAYDESIALLRAIDAGRDLASALHNQGHAVLQRGDVARARAHFEESMALQQALENKPGMAECLLGFAALAIAQQLPAAAARLLAAAAAIGGRAVTKEWAATRLTYERLLARVTAALPENILLDEQIVGQTLSLEKAVSDALATARKGAAAEAARKKLDALTPREREVALLVAQAESNDEIAEELVLSKRTVETHVSHILSKLGFASRTQIVRWALESGLVPSGE